MSTLIYLITLFLWAEFEIVRLFVCVCAANTGRCNGEKKLIFALPVIPHQHFFHGDGGNEKHIAFISDN